MDTGVGPVLNVLDHGMRPDERSFDGNASAFESLLDRDNPVIYFPPGNYYFKRKPEDISRRVVLLGDSMCAAALVRDYRPASEFEAFIKLVDGPGSRIENLSILTSETSQQGVGLLLEAQADGRSPDYSSIRNVKISHTGGAGNWSIALWLHGAPRRGRQPCGLRAQHVDNVFLFASTSASLDINSVHDAWIVASCYPAGGSTDLVRVNGWRETPCNNIACNLKTAANLQLVNISQSIFMAPAYQAPPPEIPGVKFL